MTRDKAGFPDEFSIDSRTAVAVENEVLRIREEKKNLVSRVPQRRVAPAPSAPDLLVTQ